MPTAVVCDDDGVLRSAVTSICESAGLHVLAETDVGGAAVELVRRFEVDVVVLDRSLPDVSGEHVIESLKADLNSPEIVVFSAYASEPAHLLALGAFDVVEKPDFERLELVLARLVTMLDRAAEHAGQERRAVRRKVSPVLTAIGTGTDIASRSSLLETAEHTTPGDSVLFVALTGAAAGDPTAIAEMIRSTVRIQDIVHERPELGAYVAVLRGGSDHAAAGAWSRLSERFEASATDGRLHGAFSQVDALGLMSAVERAESALMASLKGEPGLQPA